MTMPEKNCPCCAGTGYKMERLVPTKLREEIADLLYGGGCDSSSWPDTLELADEIIGMVRDSDEDA